MTFRRHWAAGALACSAFLAGAAVADSDVTQTRAVRVAIGTDVRSSNPGVNRDAVTDWVMSHVVEGLVALGDDLEPKPVLARDWTVSADGRAYTFHLREGVRFHNGAPLDSGHVRWNFERYLNAATGWLCRSWFDGRGRTGIQITAIETPDPATVVIRLAEPNRWFLTRLAHIPCGAAIVHPDSVGPDGRWLWPIGTGPYRWTQWQRGRALTFERFDAYHSRTGAPDGLAGAKPAKVAVLRLLVLPDTTLAKLAMLSGELDVWPDASSEVLHDLQRDQDIVLTHGPSRDWTVLLLQNRDPALADVRVRRSIAAALDLRDVARSTIGRTAHPNATVLIPALVESQQKERAPALKAATPLKLQVTRDNPAFFNDAIVVQQQLARAGIEVDLECMDWSTQFVRYSAGDYQLSLLSFSGRPAPALMFEVFIGDRSRRSNVVIDDSAAQSLLERITRAPDFAPARERDLLDELQRIVSLDASVLGLYNPQRVTAMRRTLGGYRPWALGTPRLWLVEPAETKP